MGGLRRRLKEALMIHDVFCVLITSSLEARKTLLAHGRLEEILKHESMEGVTMTSPFALLACVKIRRRS